MVKPPLTIGQAKQGNKNCFNRNKTDSKTNWGKTGLGAETVFFLLIECVSSSFTNWSQLELGHQLLEYKILSDPNLLQLCQNDKACPLNPKNFVKRCLGIEEDCRFENSYSSSSVKCSLLAGDQGRTLEDKKLEFWNQADFGLLKPLYSSLSSICESSNREQSTLECSSNFRYCHGKNVFVDLSNLKKSSSKRYRNDVILKGQIGGSCETFDELGIRSRLKELSYLQSWGHEFKNFETYPTFVLNSSNCDVVFDKKTIVMKLDAAINMYHHFCDFINLFLSQFLSGDFSRDVDLIWWDTYSEGYVDDIFGIMWSVFSKFKPIELIDLDGKKVCFRDVTFPLLARQRFGLYYNMPLIAGCSGSWIFKLFHEHVIHRLNIAQKGPTEETRITFIQRKTRFRQIENWKEVCLFIYQLCNATSLVV
uniref:Uncharacterized protein n=1 Tax=Bursaphelenchus xylophilus TaxID=6326 RepID=A0A1I7RH28_BURXY